MYAVNAILNNVKCDLIYSAGVLLLALLLLAREGRK